MKFDNGIEITNLRNVQRLPDGAYLLKVDLVTPTDGSEIGVPYVARGNDIAPTGQWVHQQIVEGNFDGAITDWVPPPPPSAEEVAAQVRAQRDARLRATDWTQLPDVPQATKDLWAPYRQALRDITEQTGFPYEVQWPVPPA